MNSMFLSLVITFTLFTGFEYAPHVDTYKLKTEGSSLEWNAKKVTGEHHGSINFKSGTLNDEHGDYTGTFEIQMNTIEVKDLEGQSKEKLEKHLNSSDFFDTENHPVSKLFITSMKKYYSESSVIFQANGQLTIKGITNPVAFESTVEEEDDMLRFSGEIVVDRTKYDIKYRSGQFFPEIGDKMIYDEFTLKFDVVLEK